MYGKLAAAGTAALVAFLWAGTADASSSGSSTFIWQIQDTGHSSLSGGKTALGMRDGQAWPVIFDEGGDIYGLFNAENGFTNTNWFQIGFDEYPSGRPNAASSPMGPVAVASDGGVQLSIAGVTGLPLDTVAVAYDAGGTLYTADPITTSFGDPGSFGGSIVDIAVADNGSRSFVTDHGEFWSAASPASTIRCRWCTTRSAGPTWW